MRHVWSISIALLVAWPASVALGAGPEEAPPAEAPPASADEVTLRAPSRPEPSGWKVRVFALEEYRFRTVTTELPSVALVRNQPAGEEPDHDLRFFLSGGAWEERDRFSFDLSMALWSDLDGSPGGQPSSVGSAYDVGAPYMWFDVYSLIAQYRSRSELALARVGRQTAEHGRPITYDGAHLRFRAVPRMLDLFIFGGRTKHFFEVGDALFEDWIASAGARVWPLPELQIEVDYRLHIEDTRTTAGLIEHDYGLTARFRWEDWLHLKAYLRGLDDAVSHTGLDAGFDWSAYELGADIRLAIQPSTLSEVSESNDPYVSILGVSRPHLRCRIDLWKDFTTDYGTVGIHLGWAARILFDAEPTTFNRDHGRIYLLAEATDIGIKGPFASFIVEWHYRHTGMQLDYGDLITVGGAVGWRHELFRVELGSHYQQFKYVYYQDVRELENVRTVFLAASVRPLDWLDIRLRYEYEAFGGEAHSLTFTLAQRY